MEELISKLIVSYPILGVVLAVIGLIVLLAQFIVALTPSKSDDEKLNALLSLPMVKKVWDFFLSFAPFQKKDGAIKLSKDA